MYNEYDIRSLTVVTVNQKTESLTTRLIKGFQNCFSHLANNRNQQNHLYIFYVSNDTRQIKYEITDKQLKENKQNPIYHTTPIAQRFPLIECTDLTVAQQPIASPNRMWYSRIDWL